MTSDTTYSSHVPNVLCFFAAPEQVEILEVKDAPRIDEPRRRADVVRPELSSIAESELDQVDRHEGQER